MLGETIADPLEYVYEIAPEGFIVKEVPEQIDPLLTETVGNGSELTVIFEMA